MTWAALAISISQQPIKANNIAQLCAYPVREDTPQIIKELFTEFKIEQAYELELSKVQAKFDTLAVTSSLEATCFIRVLMIFHKPLNKPRGYLDIRKNAFKDEPHLQIIEYACCNAVKFIKEELAKIASEQERKSLITQAIEHLKEEAKRDQAIANSPGLTHLQSLLENNLQTNSTTHPTINTAIINQRESTSIASTTSTASTASTGISQTKDASTNSSCSLI